MASRRQFLIVAATTAGFAPLLAWVGSPAVANGTAPSRPFPVARSDAEWRAQLSSAQYRVLRRGRTEVAGSSALNHETRTGLFECAGCSLPLFSSATKYDSGTGWPSFYAPLAGATETSVDKSWFMVRTEVHCRQCGGHLGHVFPDGPRPTGLRYCMNGAALTFVAGAAA
jgi:peptide-methionine (R)-S-oxide reductase